MSEFSRPYDEDQYKNLVQQMINQNSGVISPPEVTRRGMVDPVRHDVYGGVFSEAAFAIQGLGRRLTRREGRAERARARIEQLDNSIASVEFTAERMANPRLMEDSTGNLYTNMDPTAKLGWVGTDKRKKDTNYRPEDNANLGYQLFRRGPLFPNPKDPVGPNLDRPATRAERKASDKLEAKHEKRAKLLNDAGWLEDSYGTSLNFGRHELSWAEKRNMRKIARQVENKVVNANTLAREFEEIANAQPLKDKREVAQQKLGYIEAKIARRAARRAARRTP